VAEGTPQPPEREALTAIPRNVISTLREQGSSSGNPTNTIRAQRDRASKRSPRALPRLDVGVTGDVELRLGQLLGRGGMGEVFVAEQRALQREVAVKRPLKGVETLGMQELVREGLVTGMIDHPNVVPVHLMGVDAAGDPIIVMKRVQGVTWDVLLRDDDHEAWRGTKARSETPLLRHLEIMLEITGALELAHSRGWVHRDLKPSNVMVGTYGEVYLLDWGIATEAGTAAYAGDEGMPLGTPAYMAPEMVVDNGVIDERTDIYLLGGLLHHILTGRPPHVADSLFATLQHAAMAASPALAPDTPDELATIVRRALAREPDERHASVFEFRQAVVDFLQHHGSIELTKEGDRALATLRDRLAALSAAPSRRELVDVHSAFAEARFAYTSARRAWDHNPDALAGLSHALRHMVHHELAHGSVDAAEVLVEQLPSPDSDLERAVASRRNKRAASVRRMEGLLELERDLDTRVGSRERSLFFAVAALVGVVSLGLVVPWAGRPAVVPLEPRASIALIVVVAGGLGIALRIGRRWLLASAVNRRIVGLMYLGLVGMAVNRWYGGGASIAPAVVVTNDLIIEAVVAAAGTIAVERRMATLALGFGAGVVASAWFPERYLLVFVVSNVLALASATVAMMGARPDQPEPDDPGSK
jgi:eukaryotic-like serine/threonine-protein kinase